MMPNNHELVGANAFEVIKVILVSNSDIKSVNFKSYLPAKHFLEEDSQKRSDVSRMLKENPAKLELKLTMDRETVFSDSFSEIVNNNTAGGRCVAMLSTVKCQSTRRIFHIPMMDFGCDISAENQTKIVEFLKAIGQKGFVLVSGASYHFYGSTLLSEKDWTKFLGKMILFTDYVDVRYIGHRLNQGLCALRITKNQKLNSIVPVVVAVVD